MLVITSQAKAMPLPFDTPSRRMPEDLYLKPGGIEKIDSSMTSDTANKEKEELEGIEFHNSGAEGVVGRVADPRKTRWFNKNKLPFVNIGSMVAKYTENFTEAQTALWLKETPDDELRQLFPTIHGVDIIQNQPKRIFRILMEKVEQPKEEYNQLKEWWLQGEKIKKESQKEFTLFITESPQNEEEFYEELSYDICEYIRRRYIYLRKDSVDLFSSYCHLINVCKNKGIRLIDLHWANLGRSQEDGRMVILDLGSVLIPHGGASEKPADPKDRTAILDANTT